MSLEPISRSPDLKKLHDEGYQVEVKDGYLVIYQVPYVTSRKEVAYGILVSKLTLANNVAQKPDKHTVFFKGEHPCNKDGKPIAGLGNSDVHTHISKSLQTNRQFSAKKDYQDFYEKMTTYVAILLGPAQAIDPAVSATSAPFIPTLGEESVFEYIDTASSRADINVVSDKLKPYKIAIIGLGGTGSYVLDLVAKTPVKEIHIFDGKQFFQHSAFRAPGAASGEDLAKKLPKTTYFFQIYSKLRKGIFDHPYYVDASNVDQLKDKDFIFICMDVNEDKRMIIEKLEEYGRSFVDVGMGVYLAENALSGIVRTTTSTPHQRKHIDVKNQIPFADENDENNEYDTNIQIAELNTLNAAFAVIKWKKLCGFYHDFDFEYHSTYTIDGNEVLNEGEVDPEDKETQEGEECPPKKR